MDGCPDRALPNTRGTFSSNSLGLGPSGTLLGRETSTILDRYSLWIHSQYLIIDFKVADDAVHVSDFLESHYLCLGPTLYTSV